MPGLIQQRMMPADSATQQPNPTAPTVGEGPAGPQPGPGAATAPPTKGTQLDYQKVVAAGMRILYSEGMPEKIAQMLKAGGNPVQALAHATLLIMQQIYQQSKGTVPPDVLAPAAKEIMQKIAEMGQAAGIFKVSDQLLQQAMAAATQMFMKQQGLNPKDIMAQMQGQQAPQFQSAGVPQPGGAEETQGQGGQ